MIVSVAVTRYAGADRVAMRFQVAAQQRRVESSKAGQAIRRPNPFQMATKREGSLPISPSYRTFYGRSDGGAARFVAPRSAMVCR